MVHGVDENLSRKGKDKCLMKVKIISDEKGGEMIIHEVEENFNEGEYPRSRRLLIKGGHDRPRSGRASLMWGRMVHMKRRMDVHNEGEGMVGKTVL
mgnify:CR=1 FL=1